MRVKTLIATIDTIYTERISEYISEHHADTIEISVCNSAQQLRALLSSRRFDAALIDPDLLEEADLNAIDLPMLLWADNPPETLMVSENTVIPIRRIRKHRRISSIVADVLEQYATVKGSRYVPGEPEGCITAVWSPCGGAGKTTAALSYAMSKAIDEKDVFYLNLEKFSAVPVYFGRQGKSISTVFEMLENKSGDTGLLISGICGCHEGIKFLYAPDNYDDMNILSPDNIKELVTCCAGITGELVIDLSCVCDACTRKVFELADKILLVTDSSGTAKTKFAQFMTQSNAYESIKEKIIPVVNKYTGSAEGMVMPSGLAENAAGVTDAGETIVYLPHIQSNDEQFIYKALAKEFA